MAPPLSAYQMENFDPPPDEELICSICRCVFYNPVECPCRHVYCKTCISNWLSLRKSCPICRKRASISKLQTVVPIIKNMIMKLTIHCPNVECGCKEKISLEAYDSHLAKCAYEMMKCKNNNCKEKCFRKDMSRHEQKDCKYRTVRCRQSCSLMLPISMIKSHSCVEELKKELKEKRNLIEELKNEVEDHKKQLQKVKTELQELQNRQRTDFISDDFPYIDSDNSISSDPSVSLDNPDSDNILSATSDDNSYNINDSSNQNDNDIEGGEVSNFVDLFLMTLFPNSPNSSQQQSNEVINDSVHTLNSNSRRDIDSLWENTRNETDTTNANKQLNSSYVINMENTNESLEEMPTSYNRQSLEQSSEEIRNLNQFGDSEYTEEVTDQQERNLIGGEENLGESSDDTLPVTRKRILKRKSSIPILSDISDGGESEPQRIRRRRRTRHIVESSDESVENHRNESLTEIIEEPQFSEISKSTNINRTSIIKSDAVASRSSLSLNAACSQDNARGHASLSRVPVPVSSKQYSRSVSTSVGDLLERETTQVSQLSGNNDGTHSMSLRTHIRSNQKHEHQETRSLQHLINISHKKRTVQRALEILGNLQPNRSENVETNTFEPGEWSTLELLNRFSEESDPDWEPPDTDVEDTDATISDTIESDSSYEVQIPERTWDLLERYSQESSDNDSDWHPPVQESND